MASSSLSKDPKIKKKKQSRYESFRTLEELKTLGHQLLSSRAHINNAPILLSHLSPSSPLQHALESLLSLQSFFIPLLSDLPSSSKPPEKSDPESVYRSWLRSKFDQFVGSLMEILVSPRSEDALKDVALDAIMEFVKLGKGGKFQFPIYHKLVGEITPNFDYRMFDGDQRVRGYSNGWQEQVSKVVFGFFSFRKRRKFQ